ncbi:MAG: substrate-binding domain-containing protein, partial [Eubacteriales bacterium]|nr:substrate-binding domain-containing protein [Eubacteriales bacterium]
QLGGNMTQDKMAVWIEPSYMDTPWCRLLQQGIKTELSRFRRKVDCSVIKDPQSLVVSNGILVLAGETESWINRMLEYAYDKNYRVCMACSDSDSIMPYVSTVTLDRRGDMCLMMQYLFDNDRKRIALFGVNLSSPADQKRVEGYLSMVTHLQLPLNRNDIYPTFGDVHACVDHLFRNIDRYDAIISGNDLYAVYLNAKLKEIGVQVPEQIYLASFGNTLLSKCTTPSLTTMALDHFELGRQVVHLSLDLERNPHITKESITIEGHIFIRESTGNQAPSSRRQRLNTFKTSQEISSYSDAHLHEVVSLELCLTTCDQLDFSIIQELLNGKTVNSIADDLFISQGTLNYRLNKLYQQAGVSSRVQFESLFHAYLPKFSAESIAVDSMPE